MRATVRRTLLQLRDQHITAWRRLLTVLRIARIVIIETASRRFECCVHTCSRWLSRLRRRFLFNVEMMVKDQILKNELIVSWCTPRYLNNCYQLTVNTPAKRFLSLKPSSVNVTSGLLITANYSVMRYEP